MTGDGKEMDLPQGTPHIAPEAPIAPSVLMPGDPLRAQYISEKFLDSPRRFNSVRGMLGFTGTWKGKDVSVMGSGMGIPSMGIYSYELYSYFGVESIIRVGTCAAYRDDIELSDIVIAQASSTTSSWAEQYQLGGTFSAIPDFGLLEASAAAARRLGRRFVVGNTLCIDTFTKYNHIPKVWRPWTAMGIVATDMEAYSLYCIAASLGKKALAMFSVSDHREKDLHLSVADRETALDGMIEVALESL